MHFKLVSVNIGDDEHLLMRLFSCNLSFNSLYCYQKTLPVNKAEKPSGGNRTALSSCQRSSKTLESLRCTWRISCLLSSPKATFMENYRIKILLKLNHLNKGFRNLSKQ